MMEPTDKVECLSCAWRGEARELKELTVELQASPMDLREKTCPNCGSIAVEKINPRRYNKLL
jgi:hypothetical protein